MKLRFDHAHLRSDDPEAMANWFVCVLGAEIVQTSPSAGPPRIDLRLGGLTLFIGRTSAETGPAPRAPYRGLEHLGFTVHGIDSAIAEARSRGAEVSLEPTRIRPDLRIAFLQGPEGVSIELLEYGDDGTTSAHAS